MRILFRLFQSPSQHGSQATLEAVLKHISRTRAISCKQSVKVGRWGAAEDIMAAVWYLREPIFVMERLPNGSYAFQMYTLGLSNSVECIKIRALSTARAQKILLTSIHHGYIPMILLLEDSHYSCVRFPAEWYTDWSKPTSEGVTMPARMQVALYTVGEYAIPHFPPSVEAPAAYETSQGSLFTPSSGMATDESDDGSEGSFSQQTPVHIPDASATENDMVELLGYLNPHLRRKGGLRSLWAMAEDENAATVRHVLDDIQLSEPIWDQFVAKLDHNVPEIDVVISLLRSLPFPRVALVLLPPKLLRRIGQELAMLGHGAIITEWMNTTPSQETRDALHDWINAMHAEAKFAKKWRSSQSLDTWTRLSELDGSNMARYRTLPSSDEDGWRKLLTVLVLLDDSGRSLDDQCARAQEWITSTPTEARDLVSEISHHNWINVTWDFLVEVPRTPTAPQSREDEAVGLR